VDDDAAGAVLIVLVAACALEAISSRGCYRGDNSGGAAEHGDASNV
jgi:hypothetical protein